MQIPCSRCVVSIEQVVSSFVWKCSAVTPRSPQNSQAAALSTHFVNTGTLLPNEHQLFRDLLHATVLCALSEIPSSLSSFLFTIEAFSGTKLPRCYSSFSLPLRPPCECKCESASLLRNSEMQFWHQLVRQFQHHLLTHLHQPLPFCRWARLRGLCSHQLRLRFHGTISIPIEVL
jgi:hypothetical protein